MGKTSATIQVGDNAPDFALTSQTGQLIKLSQFLGKSCVVLYFYPKDNTMICTAESCAFRDSYEVFKKENCEVVGVSDDDVTSHQSFSARNRLPFILLSDLDGSVRKKYGVQKIWGLFPGRVTFVIDQKGVVRHIFSSQLGTHSHVEEALQIIKQLPRS